LRAGQISIDRIKQLYDLNSAVMAAARMPQIVKNFKVKSCSLHMWQ
jgi:hypothetical protein